MLTPRAASNLTTHLQRRAATYLEVCRNLEEAASTAKSLKRYIGKEDDKGSGSKLITLGIALIAFPEPTISDAVGAALVALGLLKRKMRKIGIRDVYEEMHQAANCIKEAAEYTQITVKL
jgi:hypothetical protein